MKTHNNMFGGTSRWRNIITGECRETPPSIGELDWVEGLTICRCPD